VAPIRLSIRNRNRLSEAGTEADQAINADANHKIEKHAEVNAVSLMAEALRQMRYKRKVVDGVAYKDSHQVFEPSAECHSKPLPRHVPVARWSDDSTIG
jgi:hypothetical protein